MVVRKIKYLLNSITVSRIIGSLLLLLPAPLSFAFFLIYFWCGISDALDGYIARRTNNVSQAGATLDSLADLIFTAAILIVFVPVLSWKLWMLCWIAEIAVLRFLSLAIGYKKFHAPAFLHTYANKLSGFALFCFPLLYLAAGLPITMCILCVISNLSALEELLITLSSKTLDRDVRTIFKRG